MRAIRSIGRTSQILYSLIFLPVLGFADGILRGPVTGLVHDAATGAIQRVDGMPGAALLSAAIPIGVNARVAAFDRGLRFALLADSAGDAYLVRDPIGPAPVAEQLTGVVHGVETIAVDREGKTAALYSPSQKTLQLLKGLPDRPEVFLSTVLSDAAATVTALALLPLESGALIAAGGPLQGGVFRLDSDGALVLVAEAGLVRSLAVLGPDAFVYADAARNELVQVRGAGAGAERRVLAGASDQVNDPRGVCVLDGGGLILANGAGKLLLTFDSDGRPAGSLAVEFMPGRCDAMGRGALLQLNDAGRGPLYLLDYSESLRTMFVPASPSPEVRQ